ncbi:FlhC family transcriptional regulator [Marinobacter alkaliphilus]|uniref:FlhC family transcriptional regulator n=1 Tax=Marinobacter alkaliphilus TaxID=254719 RepID=A0ABZ3E9A5_9GAMM
MDTVKKYELCEEYIRYGARVTTAKLVSAITNTKAVMMYRSIHGTGSETGRDPQKWANYLSKPYVYGPMQKFLLCYWKLAGEAMLDDLDHEVVLSAYKMYAGIYLNDEQKIGLTVAWSAARAIAQKEPGADLKFCPDCGRVYMHGKRALKVCPLCLKAKEAFKNAKNGLSAGAL